MTTYDQLLGEYRARKKQGATDLHSLEQQLRDALAGELERRMEHISNAALLLEAKDYEKVGKMLEEERMQDICVVRDIGIRSAIVGNAIHSSKDQVKKVLMTRHGLYAGISRDIPTHGDSVFLYSWNPIHRKRDPPHHYQETGVGRSLLAVQDFHADPFGILVFTDRLDFADTLRETYSTLAQRNPTTLFYVHPQAVSPKNMEKYLFLTDVYILTPEQVGDVAEQYAHHLLHGSEKPATGRLVTNREREEAELQRLIEA